MAIELFLFCQIGSGIGCLEKKVDGQAESKQAHDYFRGLVKYLAGISSTKVGQIRV